MSMEKLDALIVRNLRDLDVATKRLSYDIDVKVSRAIDRFTELWADKHRWKGKFKWDDEAELWIAPDNWGTDNSTDDDLWLGYFSFNTGFGDDLQDKAGDFFWLTSSGQCWYGYYVFPLGLRWRSRSEEGEMEKICQRCRQKLDRAYTEGRFSYDEGSGLFFMPVRVDGEALAAAIEEDAIENAIDPVFQQALDNLLAAKPEFDAMLEGAKKYFSD